MTYDKSLVEKISGQNDIVDIISSYVSLSGNGQDYFGLCPFHGEKMPSFYVNRNKQTYYCFGCHRGGNIYTFMMDYKHIHFSEALEELAEKSKIQLPKKKMSAEEQQNIIAKRRLSEMNRYTAAYFHHALKEKRGEKAMEYLKKRGLTDQTVRQFGLGYSDYAKDDLYRYLKSKGFSDDDMRYSSLVTIDGQKGNRDRFFNRVMFPIVDTGNRIIGFGGRVTDDGSPKYLNSGETVLFDKGSNLYGLNYAKKTKEKYLILCEGYMDVISLYQAGFTNAVAPLGTALTERQAMLLKRYTNHVVLSFDSDDAGKKAALRAIPILREAGIQGRVLSMAPYKDPDELIRGSGAKEYMNRIRTSVSGKEFEEKNQQ